MIPTSIVTGFLGSGKTTLINKLIKQPGMDKIALIINEFGEIGLDNLLIESSIENTLVLENGCICCSIRGDLVDTIINLFAKVENKEIPQFTRIVIETTGLAIPGPIIASIIDDIVISKKCELNNVITLIDAQQGTMQIKEYHEAKVQVSQSNLCILTKCDLASESEINDLEKILYELNPVAHYKRIINGEIIPDYLFQDLQFERLNKIDQHVHLNHKHTSIEHDNVFSCSFLIREDIDELKLRSWLAMLYSLRPFSMLRLKGIVKLNTYDSPLLLQAVGAIFYDPKVINEWPSGDKLSRLIIIFKDFSEESIKKSFSKWVLSE